MLSALRQTPLSRPRPTQQVPAQMLDILADVRMAALSCRSAARTDVFKACALLSTTPKETRPVFADAFVRCLTQAWGAAPVFFRPGVPELSFDEAWLTSALRAAQAEDDASFTFLINSRVPFEHRRAIGFLARGLMRR